MKNLRARETFRRINPFNREFRETLNEMAEACYAFLMLRADLEARIHVPLPDEPLPATLFVEMEVSDTPTVIAPGRWEYPVTQVTPLPNGEKVVTPEGFTGLAYNRVEFNNTSAATGVQGDGEDITDTAEAAILIGPIREGSVLQCTVHRVVDAGELATTFWFDRKNPTFVACTS